jgi:hypothetical protein
VENYNYMSKIIKFLDTEIIRLYKNIPNINNGGCAIFAVILGEELQKKGYNLKYTILTTNQKNQIKNGKQIIRNNSSIKLSDIYSYVPPTHVVLTLSGYYIDSCGCRKIKGSELHCDGVNLRKGLDVDVNTLKKIYYDDPSFWNHSFDRKNIKKIQKQTKKLIKLI